jgi:hypothetical protein
MEVEVGGVWCVKILRDTFEARPWRRTQPYVINSNCGGWGRGAGARLIRAPAMWGPNCLV